MIDFDKALQAHLDAIEGVRGQLPTLRQVGDAMSACLKRDGTIFWMGNGGSAADSQHLAAELVDATHESARVSHPSP